MEVQWDTCRHQVPDIDIENRRGGGEGLGGKGDGDVAYEGGGGEKYEKNNF